MSEDADALFLGLPEPESGLVRPILAFETTGFMTMFMPGTEEATDPRISTFLSGGFGLLPGAGWLFPLLEEWHIDIDEAGDLFALVDPHGFPAYSVALTEVTPSWLADVKREGKCLVLTGTGLGLTSIRSTSRGSQTPPRKEMLWALLFPSTGSARTLGAVASRGGCEDAKSDSASSVS
jgi:hypothetical protein